MTGTADRSAAPRSVQAAIKYLADAQQTPVYHASVGGEDAQLNLDGRFESHVVTIRNARLDGARQTLDEHGFALVPQRTQVSDFYDQAAVDGPYTREVETLLAELTGAQRVVVFDHTRRADTRDERKARLSREPSAVVHNDYTERSAPRRVHDFIAHDEAQALLQGRFAIVNVWRAIRNPVLTSPLALCEAPSVAPADLVPTERRARDRIGEIHLVRFNPRHRWCYYPRLQLDEAILIKTFDSAADGRARFAPHTAFEDPTSPPGAPPRESIETRAFVFF